MSANKWNRKGMDPYGRVIYSQTSAKHRFNKYEVEKQFAGTETNPVVNVALKSTIE